MSALASEVHERTRDIPGRDFSWINAALEGWGNWIWDHRDFEGYPSADPISNFIYGAGGGQAGHRVLCRDMPVNVRMMHVVWLMLPEHEGMVVWAEYVPGVSDSGRLWTREEKCRAVKVSDDVFRQRLHRARVRIWDWSCKRRN